MDQMTDSKMDHQRHGYYHSEPCIYFGGTNISQPNIHTVVTTSIDTTNIDSHYLLDAYDNNMMYRATEYTSIQHQHQHDLDMGIPVAANLYYTGMNPSSSTSVLPLPPNHRASDQLSGSSTFAVSGAYKRKNVEGIRRNYHQDFNASSASSSSVSPPTSRHTDGVAMMDTSSFPLTQFRGTSIPSCVEVGPYGTSSWSRPGGESMILHDHNHLIRGNYLRQHFQPATPQWMDQHLNSNNNDGHARAWNQPLPMPCVQAPNAHGSLLENANMGLQRYHDTASNRSGLRFLHPPPVNPHHLNFHHPSIIAQGTRCHSSNFHPPAVTGASYRVPINHSRSATIPTQTGFEMGVRHVGPMPSTSLRIYRPHRRGGISATTPAHRNLPPMGFLQVDDLPLLVDNHRDMRLDIEDMSYEELLALGERIGNVSTGLSEEMIISQMKTQTYVIPSTAINLEVVASEEQETDSCIICQDEFKNGEKIGILQCGHEYHADCLRKWLLVKNVCPICKSQAYTPGMKGA